ncbi:hypothetical protein HaLaN_03404, partial [Haematococcus lacustris]
LSRLVPGGGGSGGVSGPATGQLLAPDASGAFIWTPPKYAFDLPMMSARQAGLRPPPPLFRAEGAFGSMAEITMALDRMSTDAQNTGVRPEQVSGCALPPPVCGWNAGRRASMPLGMPLASPGQPCDGSRHKISGDGLSASLGRDFYRRTTTQLLRGTSSERFAMDAAAFCANNAARQALHAAASGLEPRART